MRAAESCMPRKLVRGSVMNSKRCSKCEVVKPRSAFSVDNSRKSGLQPSCRECRKVICDSYRKRNKTKIKEWSREYNQRQEVRDRANRLRREKTKNNPSFRLYRIVSRRVHSALTRNNGSKLGSATFAYLPYTPEELVEHIEKQWEPWMSWENYGEWHIDHIYPQSKLPYDSMTHPNFLKCWALENLQPLEASENQSKGNRLYEREAA